MPNAHLPEAPILKDGFFKNPFSKINASEYHLLIFSSIFFFWDDKPKAYMNREEHHSRQFYMGRVKQKSVFKHAQNVWIYIILHMHEVSSEYLLSMETFYSMQWFCK